MTIQYLLCMKHFSFFFLHFKNICSHSLLLGNNILTYDNRLKDRRGHLDADWDTQVPFWRARVWSLVDSWFQLSVWDLGRQHMMVRAVRSLPLIYSKQTSTEFLVSSSGPSPGVWGLNQQINGLTCSFSPLFILSFICKHFLIQEAERQRKLLSISSLP